MSALSQIAKDPSCLLAVDALQGGRWLSCIKPDGVQPSSVQRNFSESPETWYLFTSAYNSIGIDDFELDIVFNLNACTNKNIFWAIASLNGIGIYRGSTAAGYDFVIQAMRIVTDSSGQLISSTLWRFNAGTEISDTLSGIFHVKITRIGTTVSAYGNGNRVGTYTGAGIAPTNLTGNCSSNFDGSIQEVTLKNLTTGKIVWRYPSWEERTRLLTLTNITTAGGVFRAADEAKSAGIKTPLDFRGNTASKTFIVRAFCPSHDDSTKNLFLHPFFTQGRWTYGKDYFVFGFGIWEDFRGTSPMRQLRFAASGDSIAATNPVDASNLLDQWHVFAVSYEMASSGQKFALYADGQLLTSGTNAAEVYPWRSNPTTTPGTDSGKVYIRDNAGDGTYVAGTVVSSALIFDRALTQPEIAAISNTMG